MVRSDFYDQAFSPSVLLAGQFLHGPDQLPVAIFIQNMCGCIKLLICHSHLHTFVRLNIQHPVGSRVLGDDVELPIATGKPDLNFALPAANAAARSQIQILGGLELAYPLSLSFDLLSSRNCRSLSPLSSSRTHCS